MIHFDMPPMKSNIIKVLGFGGGGTNAVNHMYKQQIKNVDFIICNTDAQSLATSDVPIKIQLGPHLTQGLGAGANPEVGKKATEESIEEIKRMLEINTKMCFITAGMGGGTGTGGAPAIAKVCKEMNILTVGIVTTPFGFEGPKRMKQAQDGINELKKQVDTLLVINNDKLRHQYGNLKMGEAFSKADNVLSTAARCITDIINTTGQMNVDFADVCTVMKDGGVAILGSATASGEGRGLKAIEQAINSPLLNDNDISGAKWILLNITSAEGEHEYTMDEVDAIQAYVRSQSGETTDVILGMGYDSTFVDELGVTIIATGFGHRDPFAPASIIKKPEPLLEKVIVGVLGQQQLPENNEQHVMTSLPIENKNPMAPMLQVNIPVPNEVQPIAHEMAEEPVFMMLSDMRNEEPTLEIVEEKIPMAETKTEPAFNQMSMTLIERPDETEALAENKPLATNGFLSKPTNIYAEQPSIFNHLNTEPEIIESKIEMENSFELNVEMPVAETETSKETPDFELFLKEETPLAPAERNHFFGEQIPMALDLSEEEEQKQKAQERMEKIKKLRNLSFNFNNTEGPNEFDQVPAYMRRDMELHNSIANVENFYSRAQIKTDENDKMHIVTINTYLDGKNPD